MPGLECKIEVSRKSRPDKGGEMTIFVVSTDKEKHLVKQKNYWANFHK